MNNDQMRREIINRVIGIEGAYVNDARDSGGATKYGITERVAKVHGLKVANISVADAFAIYEADYWHPLKLEVIAKLSESVADELFEQGVNMGVSRAAKHLQESLNLLNQNGRLWSDISVDNNIGSQTLNALRAFFSHRGERSGKKVLLSMLNTLQSDFYMDLAKRRPKDEAFIYGWQNNRVSNVDPEPVRHALFSNPAQQDPYFTAQESRQADYRPNVEPEFNGWRPPQDTRPSRDNETKDPAYAEWLRQQEALKHAKPWYTSKINIAQMVSMVVTVTALFGLDVSAETQATAIGGMSVAFNVFTFISRTFFTKKRVK